MQIQDDAIRTLYHKNLRHEAIKGTESLLRLQPNLSAGKIHTCRQHEIQSHRKIAYTEAYQQFRIDALQGVR